jgi:hypothetical protein
MKLSTAMSYSGLSEEAIKKLPCSWRSYFGNSFAVWKCTELDAAKAAAARAAEQALIDKHGAEGLAQMRAKQVAAAAKKQADERRTAAEAAAVRELSSMMAAVQAKRGSAPEPSFDGIVVEQPRRESSLLEKVVPKAKAKQVFGLTEGDLRGMADKGPCGRSKSSFTLDSVLQQSKKCRRGSYNNSCRCFISSCSASRESTPHSSRRLPTMLWARPGPWPIRRARRRTTPRRPFARLRLASAEAQHPHPRTAALALR